MLDLLGWGGNSDDDLKEGDRLFGIGSYAEAELFFAKAASNVTGYFGPETRRARILIALAQTQWKQDKLKDAYTTASAARELISARRNSSDLAVCLNLLGDIQAHRGNSREARQLFAEALDVQERVRPAQATVLVQRCRQLAKALISAESSEARALLDHALAIACKRVGTRSVSAADCLMDLGEFQITHEEMGAGLACMERAIDIYREENGNTCEEAASGFQRLAHACHVAGDLEKAVHFYEKALHIRDRQVGGNPADLGILLLGLAEAQSLMGNEAPAIELLQQAVGKLQGTGDGHLANALENLGESYGRIGRFGEAISCLQKSRALWETDPESNKKELQENAVRLEEAMKFVPQPEVSSTPVFREAQSPRMEASGGSSPAQKRRMSTREFYGPPPKNPAARERWRSEQPQPAPAAQGPLVSSAPPAVLPISSPSQATAQAAPLTASSPAAASFVAANPVPINLEIHAPLEQGPSNIPSLPDLGSAGSTAIPALVKLTGIDQRMLSQQTLHLTIFNPSQSSPEQAPKTHPVVVHSNEPSIALPSAKSGILSGWDDLEFDFICAR